MESLMPDYVRVVYPRVGGGNYNDKGNLSGGQGLSPRGRGKR